MVILSGRIWIYVVSCNWLCFSRLTALGGEKGLFRPFVFMKVTALGVNSLVGHNVIKKSVPSEARGMYIIDSFVFRWGDHTAPDRAPNSARPLPRRSTTWVSPEYNPGKAARRSSP